MLPHGTGARADVEGTGANHFRDLLVAAHDAVAEQFDLDHAIRAGLHISFEILRHGFFGKGGVIAFSGPGVRFAVRKTQFNGFVQTEAACMGGTDHKKSHETQGQKTSPFFHWNLLKDRLSIAFPCQPLKEEGKYSPLTESASVQASRHPR